MSFDPVPEVDSIDRSQWQPHQYGLIYHFSNFARLANSVITEPGELQGWFGEALWRHYSYAPFNARVMENHHSLAFFYGYDAPWNVYYKDPRVLSRLELALNYTFNLMGDNGAIPEYATSDMDSPMLAPSSFGMEYMTSALEFAGDILPSGLKKRLAEQARKAAIYVLTSDESWAHAREFTNQFLGAMSGGAQLARLTGDHALRATVEKAGDALLEVGNFMSPMGFLYENSGPETFAYFFTSLSRLIPLYHEWPDARVLEVLRRQGAWMSRWMLLEPDGETVLLSGSHQTRTGCTYRLNPRSWRGFGDLLSGKGTANGPGDVSGLDENGDDARRFVKIHQVSAEACAIREAGWHEGPDPVAECRARSTRDAYTPVSMSQRFMPYAPPEAEIAAAKQSLPCLDGSVRCETLSDDRGNQFVFLRQPNFYVGMTFGTRRTTANYGPGFLWHPRAGTLIVSENGDRPCWETRAGNRGTGKAFAQAEVREGRGGHEVLLKYADPGCSKTYVVRPEGINVLVGTRHSGGLVLTETIPLLLREEDVLHLDYGRCPAGGLSSRVLGLVTKTLGIERSGERILSFDLGAKTNVTIKPSYDAGGYVRALVSFPLPAVYFGRSGYQIRVGA